MRKITKEAIEHFKAGKNFNKQNTAVRNIGNTVLSLHGNDIAELRNGQLFITLAGWNTPTTRERLNGFDGVRVHTKQRQAYLNGKAWGGELVNVSTFA